MTSRPSLVRSIPFWVLFAGSLALIGFGAWMVFDRLALLESGIRNQSADPAQQLDTTIAAYLSPPAATVGGLILGAGLVGLLLTLAIAAISTILPRPVAPVVEAIDWSDDAETETETPVAATPAAEDPDVEVPSDTPAPPRATAEPDAHDEPKLAEPPTQR